MKGKYFFTSESVTEGHPDKVCDQVSDAVLDAIFKEDPNARVAVETLVTTGLCMVAGEVTTKTYVEIPDVVREAIKAIGYDDPKKGFDWESVSVLTAIHAQSPDIAQGVDDKAAAGKESAEQGAGDQGMMFGFAINETENLMPLPITLASELAKSLDEIKNTLTYLRPDGKTQVTVEFKNNKPIRITQVVIAVPHSEEIEFKQVKNDIYKFVVKPTLLKRDFKISERQLVLNGTGVWHIGGPAMDVGLTGRKIIVDTYGGFARVGGGAFSGKDPSKVDRSGAYAARFLAKNIVAEELAEKAEVSLAYFIGAKKPVMVNIETFGTQKASGKILKDFADKILDTSVEGIIKGLDLKKPIYSQTSAYGHFGRQEFSWEKIV